MTADVRSAAPQAGALDRASLRHVVTVLSTVQIVSWGVLYYAFAALQSSITADTGWSSVAVTGAFSLAQFVSGGIGIWVGRHIDGVGPRKVMTLSSLVAIPGVATVALAPNLVVFYLGWLVVGIAMAGTLYPPAFAALTRWGGTDRVRALTTLTLVAGLASTVFAPLASGLDDWLGWRVAYLVLLAGLALVTVPLHWWGLNKPWQVLGAPKGPGAITDRAQPVGSIARSTPFLLLTTGNALASLAGFGVLINLVPMLVEQGMTRNLAAIALGLGGYGSLNGILTAPALVASAAAPFVGATLAHLLGSYTAAFLVLAAVATVASGLSLGATPRAARRAPRAEW